MEVESKESGRGRARGSYSGLFATASPARNKPGENLRAVLGCTLRLGEAGTLSELKRVVVVSLAWIVTSSAIYLPATSFPARWGRQIHTSLCFVGAGVKS